MDLAHLVTHNVIAQADYKKILRGAWTILTYKGKPAILMSMDQGTVAPASGC